MEPHQNKVENSESFSSPKSDRQFTTFYQQPTTISPAKNHTESLVFYKTPCKNTSSPSQKKSAKLPGTICHRARGPSRRWGRSWGCRSAHSDGRDRGDGVRM